MGVGTAFKIYLPKVEGEAERIIRKPVSGKMPRGNETVLVVEDEEEVRDLIVRILKQLGYRVFKALSGEEASLLSKMIEDPVDLILTDIVLPGMNGIELAKDLRKKWHQIKVLFMSGYTSKVIAHQLITESRISIFRKPFMPQDLAQKVREVLDE